METKQPGYYRKLLENIEMEATDQGTEHHLDVGENEHIDEAGSELQNLAKAIYDALGNALATKDPAEMQRSLQGARNSMEELMLSMRRAGV